MSRRRTMSTLALGVGLLTVAACGGGSGFDDQGSGSGKGAGDITVLIGSSGDAETAAVKKAVAEWSAESGTKATVSVASDLNQQLSQGFAADNPPDVFYLSTDSLGGYAENGSLYAYGDQLSAKDEFFPNLRQAFTVDEKLQCAPKDFSTLALWINKDLWKQAGLGDADIPQTWDDLRAVAKKLTKGKVTGLAFSPEYQRVGAFMAQAGGGMTNADQTEATVDDPANVEALTYVKELLADGSAQYSSKLGAGWGGEAFGKGLSAMTIEGNWLIGAMKNDFPDVDYQVAELPAGPSGKGTLAFTNCWGIAANSPDKKEAVALVEKLTSVEDQAAFAEAFGVIPSVESAAADYKASSPLVAPFIDGAAYAQNPPSTVGSADVISDFNSQLETLENGDPAKILASVQSTLQATIAK